MVRKVIIEMLKIGLESSVGLAESERNLLRKFPQSSLIIKERMHALPQLPYLRLLAYISRIGYVYPGMKGAGRMGENPECC